MGRAVPADGPGPPEKVPASPGGWVGPLGAAEYTGASRRG